MKPSDHEQSLIEHQIPKDQPAVKHKRKRPQGPNPLSMKKRTRFSVPDKVTKKVMVTKSKVSPAKYNLIEVPVEDNLPWLLYIIEVVPPIHFSAYYFIGS